MLPRPAKTTYPQGGVAVTEYAKRRFKWIFLCMGGTKLTRVWTRGGSDLAYIGGNFTPSISPGGIGYTALDSVTDSANDATSRAELPLSELPSKLTWLTHAARVGDIPGNQISFIASTNFNSTSNYCAMNLGNGYGSPKTVPAVETGGSVSNAGSALYDVATGRKLIVGTTPIASMQEVFFGASFNNVSGNSFHIHGFGRFAWPHRMQLMAISDFAITGEELDRVTRDPYGILFESGFKPLWTPGSASVTLPTLVQPNATTSAGAWTATGVLGPNTIINGNFTSWTGDNPDFWGVSPAETGASYVTQVGNTARIVSDGTNVGISQTAGTQVGKTYKLTIVVESCSGTIGIQANNGQIMLPITAPGTYSTNVTLTHVGVGFKRHSACDATVSSFECQEVLATSPDLHDAINELVASDTQYISVNSASTTELVLAEAAFPGGSTQAAYYDALSADNASITVIFKQGGTEISRRTHLLTPVNTRYSTVFTPAEIALIVAGPISVLLTSS